MADNLLLISFLACLAPLTAGSNFSAATTHGASINNSVSVLVVDGHCSQERINASRVLQHVLAAAADVMGAQKPGFSIINRGTEDLSDVQAVLDGLLDSPQLAVIHPGCSNAIEFLADIAEYFDTTLVSYTFSSLPSTPHSNHLRMVPSEDNLAEGVVSVLKFFGWNRLVVLTQDFPVFGSISNVLEEKLAAIVESKNVTITKPPLLQDTEDINFPVDNRIFLLNSYPSMAANILCKGWKDGRVFPLYVWITYEWNDNNWWEHGSNCSKDEMEKMMNGSLVISHYQSAVNVTGSFDNFTTNYDRCAYDAIKALSELVDLNGAAYTESYGKVVISSENITFDGASGPVSFKDGIRQLTDISIKQYRKVDDDELVLVTIGKQPANEPGNFTFEPGETNETVWNGSKVPPVDGTPLSDINPPLFELLVLMYAYATGGIVFAAVCMIFNFTFRKKKLIRLTSPNINYIIIVGAVVFYCSVYTFFYIGSPSIPLLTAICNVRGWLVALGFTLCFGPINVKMWRVYHICHKPNLSLKKKAVKDWHLMIVVMGFLLADIITLGIVSALDSARYSVRLISDKERHDAINDEGITVTYQVYTCFSKTEVYWLPILIGYKVVLQAIGAFLAFNIRKVKIKGLNDSREISAILYITTILTFILVLSNFVFGDYINVDSTVYSMCISTSTTCVLGFIFIPKMVALYKDPNGEKIFTQTPADLNNTVGKSQPPPPSAVEDKNTIYAQELKIKGLEYQLEELTKSPSPNTTITSADLENGTVTTSLTQSE